MSKKMFTRKLYFWLRHWIRNWLWRHNIIVYGVFKYNVMLDFRHYEDWNEVWKGDKEQGRKGLVWNHSLPPLLVVSLAPPLQCHVVRKFLFSNRFKPFKNCMAKTTSTVTLQHVILQHVSYGMFYLMNSLKQKSFMWFVMTKNGQLP